jgi:hypothetical protein
MAKAKSSKLGSKQFFTIVVASVAALAVIFLTTSLAKQSTDSESHASEGGNAHLVIRTVYDSNNSGVYESDKDKCYVGPLTAVLGVNTNLNYNLTDSTGCVVNFPITIINNYHYPLRLATPSRAISYIRVTDAKGENKEASFSNRTTEIYPILNGETRVIFGLEGNSNDGNNRPNQPSNCKPSISYHGSDGASKSVTYRFGVNNNCKDTQTYRVWTSIDTNGTSGWTYKFANGDVNSSIKKTIAGGDSGQASVTVSRAGVSGLPRGNSKYSVTFKVAPCNNANNRNDISDVNKDKMDTYTTTYTVEN